MPNVYKLVIPPGCGYPMIVPARTTAKPTTWLPYGRRVQPIASLGGGEAESYFHKREVRAATQDDAINHDSESASSSPYPRIINEFTQEDM
jgi:hypothetical protein